MPLNDICKNYFFATLNKSAFSVSRNQSFLRSKFFTGKTPDEPGIDAAVRIEFDSCSSCFVIALAFVLF